jgi:hypothetical protein
MRVTARWEAKLDDDGQGLPAPACTFAGVDGDPNVCSGQTAGKL